MWLPTLCAGVALPLILVLQFWSESGYLHVVLMSHWVPFWCCNKLDQKAPTCALCSICTGSNFGNGNWIQEWLPTLCAGVALYLISILKCWSKSGYLHFVRVSHWIEFWYWSLNWKVAAYTLRLRRTSLILILKCWPAHSNWKSFVTQTTATYTLCWWRSGFNFDNGIWIQKWLHALFAGVALDRILILVSGRNNVYLHLVLVWPRV